MKFKMLCAAIALSDTAMAQYALADRLGADWMPNDQAIQKLSKERYAKVHLKTGDGHWDGEATKGGRIDELHVGPRVVKQALPPGNETFCPFESTLRRGEGGPKGVVHPIFG
ncbi:PepSY domain-containing protein [Caballeronia sp. LZ065]|uniref:PepSY domain-containing protein n=1 Tax=Caballeronia sp. LZ065 TaxID=3038571 RepID=UPI00286306CA|nr:PepSY domain-containing protein [Caballeronia sp. LZ065]MDR5777867.1 PepSY domain-containing protein [Caballeronia sp. LZ065]